MLKEIELTERLFVRSKQLFKMVLGTASAPQELVGWRQNVEHLMSPTLISMVEKVVTLAMTWEVHQHQQEQQQ